MPPTGLKRFLIDGREWYSEISVLRSFNLKCVREMRDQFSSDFTFLAILPNQRSQLIEQGVLPKSMKCGFILCDDIDAYLERNAIQPPESVGPSSSNDDILEEKVPMPCTCSNDSAQSSSQGFDDDAPRMPVLQPLAETSTTSTENDVVKHEPICCCEQNEKTSGEMNNQEPVIVRVSISDSRKTVADARVGVKRFRMGAQFEPPTTTISLGVKEEKKFVCRSCPFYVEFPNETVFLRHMDLAHLKNPSVIQVQNMAVPPPPPPLVNLAPMGRKRTQKEYTCNMCSDSFDSLLGLRHHKDAKNHYDRIYKCAICSLGFTDETEMNQHVEKDHSFRCTADGCKCVFTRSVDIINHVTAYHEEKAWICHACFTMFRSYAGYCLHVKSTCRGPKLGQDKDDDENRARREKFQCDICQKTFAVSLTLLYHRRTTHAGEAVRQTGSVEEIEALAKWNPLVVETDEGQRFSCRICSQHFLSKMLLRQHEFNHLGIGQFKCNICNQSFITSRLLMAHKRSHFRSKKGRNDKYRCKFCPRKFISMYNLKTHVIAFHVKEYDNCNNDFFIDLQPNSEKKTTIKKSTHYDKNATSFSCDVCGAAYRKPISLAIHKRRHEAGKKTAKKARKKKEIPCDVCGAVFNKQSSLRNHKKIHKPNKKTAKNTENNNETSTTLFPCDVCGAVYRKLISLALHKRRHKNSKTTAQNSKNNIETPTSFPCDECGAVFQKAISLAVHQRSHSFPCDKCRAVFRRSSILASHYKRQHENVKCDQCGKTFSNAFKLRKHLDGHAEVKQYACDRCGKEFTYKSTLALHRRTRCLIAESEKFKCGFCQKSFVLSRGLKSHISHRHSAEKNNCWHCGEKFQEKAQLKQHLQSVHSDKLLSQNAAVEEPSPSPVQPPTNDNDDGPPPLYMY